MSLEGRHLFFYHSQFLLRESFLPIIIWWNWSILGDDGLRVLRPLGCCNLGLSDELFMFPESCKGLPVGLERWIAGDRADSFEEVIIYEVKL